MSVATLLEGRRVLICAGSGGVGKTTTAATVAAGMAARGLRVCVVTIDPARRLADSLGLGELGGEPRQVDPARFAGSGLDMRGELWATMLDVKGTFDDLIERIAPDPESAAEVLRNPIYQRISTAVAGSQEFTAVAKLYELHRDGGYDLLVLDTPPSRHALDFLDAPDRLTQFLEGRGLRALMRPTGLASRVVGRGTGLVFSVLRRITGVDLLSDLSVFFRALGGMVDGINERARQVRALLADPGTTFLLVTSPEREPVDEALWFSDKLAAAGMGFGGVVVNRVHHDHLGDRDAADVRAALAPRLGGRLAERVADNFSDYHLLARRDAIGVERLREGLRDLPLIEVPHLDADVHDIAGLARMHAWLFAPERARERMLREVVA